MFHKRSRVEEAGEHWSTSLGTTEEGPLAVRVNDALGGHAGNPAWRWRLAIRVVLHDADGFPDPAEQEDLRAIEDRVREVISDGRAVLALVLSGAGAHDFVMHGRSQDWFRDFARELAETTKDHRILASIEEDPGWELYQRWRR